MMVVPQDHIVPKFPRLANMAWTFVTQAYHKIEAKASACFDWEDSQYFH